MRFDLVTIAIPLFAVSIAIETWLIARSGRTALDRTDSINNVFIGLASVVFGAISGAVVGAIYAAAYSISPFKFPADAWWSWAILFVLDDFAYYWFHRVSHESRLFWNFHVVHHSSEQYNLSVAVRQSWFGGLVNWLFYVPLMFLGFAPWMFAVTHGLNLIWQFWIHTRLVGKLGIVEKVLNTPSHHRVHHGVNDEYIDKNYAGVFIIWDKIFGSFIEEGEEPRYGIIKPLRSYNPLWANTHAWFEMATTMKKTKSLQGKLRCIFGSPNMDFVEKPVATIGRSTYES